MSVSRGDSGRVTRRSLLRAGAATAALGLAGCGIGRRKPSGPAASSSPSPTPTPSPSATVRTAPTDADWRALASDLQGSLLRPGDVGYDSARVVFNPLFDGIRPPAVVRCGDPADAGTALDFARRFGLTVAPRSGGHSYVGGSTSDRGIVIDTGPLRKVAYDAATGIVTLGAGARLIDVYATLAARGRAVPAGSCATVGISGLALGGGVGMAVVGHGLTCDTVADLDLVTADGRRRTIGPDRDPDLFWACRGGGGGNFGVVTEWRLRTFPARNIGSFSATWAWRDAAAVVTGWQRRVARMPDSSWHNLHLDARPNGTTAVHIGGISFTGDAHAELAALTAAVGRQPIRVRASKHSYLAEVKIDANCPNVAQCHLPPEGTAAREAFVAGSDVLGSALDPAAAAALVRVVEQRAAAGHAASALVDPFAGVATRVAPDATAFPWRKAVAIVQWYVPLSSSAGAATVSAARNWVRAGHTAVSRRSVGHYINYPEPDVPDLAQYYGPHLGRLRQIKAAHDPDRVFSWPFGL